MVFDTKLAACAHDLLITMVKGDASLEIPSAESTPVRIDVSIENGDLSGFCHSVVSITDDGWKRAWKKNQGEDSTMALKIGGWRQYQQSDLPKFIGDFNRRVRPGMTTSALAIVRRMWEEYEPIKTSEKAISAMHVGRLIQISKGRELLISRDGDNREFDEVTIVQFPTFTPDREGIVRQVNTEEGYFTISPKGAEEPIVVVTNPIKQVKVQQRVWDVVVWIKTKDSKAILNDFQPGQKHGGILVRNIVGNNRPLSLMVWIDAIATNNRDYLMIKDANGEPKRNRYNAIVYSRDVWMPIYRGGELQIGIDHYATNKPKKEKKVPMKDRRDAMRVNLTASMMTKEEIEDKTEEVRKRLMHDRHCMVAFGRMPKRKIKSESARKWMRCSPSSAWIFRIPVSLRVFKVKIRTCSANGSICDKY